MQPKTFLDVLDDRITARPDAPFLVFPNEDLTLGYHAFAELAQGAAAQMAEAGLRPGDTVVVPADRSPAFFVALWGAWLARLNVGLLNPDLAPAELAGAIDLADPAALLAGPDSPLEDATGVPRLIIDVADPDLPRPWSRPSTRPDDHAAIVFTSGTTGRPKGVRHTHASLATCVGDTVRAFDFQTGAVMLSVLPLFHLHGLLMTTVLPAYFGGCAVVAEHFGPFTAVRFWDLVRVHGVNHFSAVPGILDLLAKFHARLPEPRFPSLRFAFCASAPLSAQLRRAWHERIGCPIANNYGLVEAASWVTHGSLDPDAPLTSVGKPGVCTIEILDEQGHVVAAGEVGEVTIRGPQLMQGYLREPERTADVLRDGRLFTGDLGRFDDQGRLYLEGRKVEVINIGGLKASPTEIEGALLGMPGVRDVAAFGWPDAHLGEVPAVALVADGAAPTLADVRLHVAEVLSPYKAPRKIFVVDALPRNALGKLQRLVLRDRLLEAESRRS